MPNWTQPYEIHPITVYHDARGRLFEFLRFIEHGVPAAGYLFTFSVLPGQRRGDHYHLRRREWTVCVNGRAICHLTDLDSGRSERVVMDADQPVLVYNGPRVTHAFECADEQPAVLLTYGSEPFNPDDPDTLPARAGEPRAQKP